MTKKPTVQITSQGQVKWWQFAQSFLSLARIGLEELMEQKYINKRSFEYSDSYEHKHLLIPVLYNIKNAIELVIKFLGITVDKEYVKSHDLNELQDYLEQTINDRFPNLSKREKVDEIAKIASRYYKLEFWNGKLLIKGSVLDIQNDVFRYPDNSASFIFDTTVLRTVSREDLEELLEDIDNLKSLMGIIAHKISEEKFHNIT